MDKDVLLKISGLQVDEGQDDVNIETITKAQYYKKNDSHYVIYEEVTEGFSKPTKNVIKFKENMLDLTKKGNVNVHMLFEENKRSMSNYATPFGNVLVGVDTGNISMEETENQIQVSVDYTLELNYEYLAECKISMEIFPHAKKLELGGNPNSNSSDNS